MNADNRDDSLKWDVLLVVFTHAVLFVILFVCLSVVLLVFVILFDWGASLPLSARLLLDTGYPCRHPLLTSLFVVVFLLTDARTYRWLCMSKSKRAGTFWAIGVTLVLALAILWYCILSAFFLNWVSDGLERQKCVRYTLTQLDTISTTLADYTQRNGAPPSLETGLLAVATNADRHSVLRRGRIPRDTWGNAFKYELRDGKPVVSSSGPDGIFGTDDDVKR